MEIANMEQNQTRMGGHKGKADLRDFMHTLLRKWWLLLLGALLGGALTIVITNHLLTPRFQASATLYVLSHAHDSAWEPVQVGAASPDDYLFIARSRATIDWASEIIRIETGWQYSREDIQRMLSVSFIGDRILRIAVTSESPSEAALVANAVAQATILRVQEITHRIPPTEVERAEVPLRPVRDRINAPIGAGVGVLLVLIFLIIRFTMNDGIKNEEDIRKYLGLNTLAVLPEGDK